MQFFYPRPCSRLPRSTENPANPALRPLKTQQNEQIPVAKYTIPPKSRTSHPAPSYKHPAPSHERPEMPREDDVTVLTLSSCKETYIKMPFMRYEDDVPSLTLSSCFPTLPLHNNAHINAHIKMLLRRQRNLADIFLAPENLPKIPVSPPRRQPGPADVVLATGNVQKSALYAL